jgi:ADP-dependent NAD(P)H-hydrate dehydratase
LPYAKTSDAAQPVVPKLLDGWPLPQPDDDGDKDTRGRVLVVGGAPEMPGAVILAATATLRSGAGKLQIATSRSIASHVAVAVPEARVFALPETSAGGIEPSATTELVERANQVEALLIGPGMVDEAATRVLLAQLLPQLDRTVVVLDALALTCEVRPECAPARLARNAILTPHAGEMATLVGLDKAAVSSNPSGVAHKAAAALGAVIVLKGANTYIAAPDGALYQYSSGNVGLATSGSGDTLAGVVAGLAARGAPPVQAAGWGVYLHGEAGNQLAKRIGRIGYLARELLDEIPPVMNRIARDRSAGH